MTRDRRNLPTAPPGELAALQARLTAASRQEARRARGAPWRRRGLVVGMLAVAATLLLITAVVMRMLL